MDIHHKIRRDEGGYGFMAITEAILEDIDDLLSIDRQCFDHSWGKGDWARVIVADCYHVMVASRTYKGKRSGPIEGYVVYGEGQFIGENVLASSGKLNCLILSIAVLMDSRQQGIGGKLLQSVSTIGIKDTHVHIALHANEAMELFSSHGFICAGVAGDGDGGFVHMVNRVKKKELEDGRKREAGESPGGLLKS